MTKAKDDTVEIIRDTYNRAYEQGKLAGMQEVVDWIGEHGRMTYSRTAEEKFHKEMRRWKSDKGWWITKTDLRGWNLLVIVTIQQTEKSEVEECLKLNIHG